jgi:hypothetical protein
MTNVLLSVPRLAGWPSGPWNICGTWECPFRHSFQLEKDLTRYVREYQRWL